MSRTRLAAVATAIALALPAAASAGVNTWTTNGPAGAAVRALAVDPVTPSTIYAATNIGLFKSTDSGGSWTRKDAGFAQATPNVSDVVVDPVTPSTVWAVAPNATGTFGVPYRTTNGGEGVGAWAEVATGIANSLQTIAIAPSAHDTLYAGGVGGTVYTRTSPGGNWSSIGAPSAQTVLALAVDPANASVVLAGQGLVGQNGNVGRFATTWTVGPATPGLTQFVRSVVWNPGASQWLAATDGGLRTSLTGLSWSNLLDTPVSSVAVDPGNPSVLWAGSFSQPIRRSADGGATWTNLGLDTAIVNDVALNPANTRRVYAATFNGVYAFDLTAPAATTGAATGVTSTGAQVAGTVTPQSLAASYRFEYGTTAAYGSVTPLTDAGSGAAPVAVAATLSGLTPGTTYHYRVVATGLGGTTNGTDATFTTPPAATTGGGATPPSPPATPPPPPAATPPPPPAAKVLDARVRLRVKLLGARFQVLSLRVTGAARGAKVVIRCVKGCSLTRASVLRDRTQAFTAVFGSRRIPVGAVIEVRITQAGFTGRYERFRVTRTTVVGTECRITPKGKLTACSPS